MSIAEILRYRLTAGALNSRHLTAAACLVAAFTISSPVTAECTAEDIEEMQETMSPEEIEESCAREADAPVNEDRRGNVGGEESALSDCRRRLDKVVGEHYDLMNSVDKRFLSGRDREMYDQEERTIWGSSDTVYSVQECEEAVGQYESINRQLETAASQQERGEEKYDECLSKLEALRDEMAEHDIQSPDGRPESLEMCEEEYTYEKHIYRSGLMSKRQQERVRG